MHIACNLSSPGVWTRNQLFGSLCNAKDSKDFSVAPSTEPRGNALNCADQTDMVQYRRGSKNVVPHVPGMEGKVMSKNGEHSHGDPVVTVLPIGTLNLRQRLKRLSTGVPTGVVATPMMTHISSMRAVRVRLLDTLYLFLNSTSKLPHPHAAWRTGNPPLRIDLRLSRKVRAMGALPQRSVDSTPARVRRTA